MGHGRKGAVSTPENPGNSPYMNWIAKHLDYPHEQYCLIWPFARGDNGYASTTRDGKFIYIHRYICELVNGPPPTDAHQAAHSCGNGHLGCVNPHHLSWKTPAENQLDVGARRRRTKLKPEQVIEIRGLRGIENVADTAARFGVTEANIRQIQSGKTWRADRRLRADLPDELVLKIRRLGATMSAWEVSKEVGLDNATCDRIIKGKTYKDVREPA